MPHQIACPECGHRFSLKAVKPGNFKPACTACKKLFSLQVREGDPPELVVRKLPAASPERPPGEPRARQATETMADPGAPAAGGPDRAHGSESVRTANARNAPPERTVAGLEQTMDAPPSAAEGGRGSLRGQTDAGHLEQTIDNPGARPASRPATAGGAASAPGLEETAAGPQLATQQATPAAAAGAMDVPARLGGYRIVSELGRGGMGAVYLANQISLDRNVALKTIKGGWAANPRAVARFIREAYAAAQLTHHNVVQIYDLGEERGTNFFSMELVNGGSLQDLLKKHGRIEPRHVTSMMIQAARGLKFAHDHGMVHRDIKPANLMLTSDGLVKVADLGLVKTPSQADDLPIESGDVNPLLSSARSNVTDAGSSMGTPAYMAPEQAADATAVDHRADIYSLGCTMYALLTGLPPFKAKSVKEMMLAHRTQPFPKARDTHPDVPEALDRIIQRMVAKNLGDRYQDLGEVIADFEQVAATADSRQSLHTDQNIGRLAEIAKRFNAVPLLAVRRWGPMLLGLLAVLVLAGLLIAGQYRAATSVVVGALAFPVVLGLIAGFQQGASPVGSRLRTVLFGSRWTEWVTWALGAILIVAVAFVLGLIPWWLAGIVVAAGLAAGWYFGLTRTIAAQRAAAGDAAQKLLRSLRAAGLDELSIRDFFATYAGKDWEEFFESVFGYDAMREARKSLEASGKSAGLRRFAPWRDTLIDRMESTIRARKAEHDQATLARTEQAGLQAAGMSMAEARRTALANAASLVDAAWQIREAPTLVDGQAGTDAAQAKRERIKAMLAAARSGPRPESASFAQRAREAAMNHLLGGKLRFLLGAAMLAGVAFWMKQNGFLEAQYWQNIGAEAAAATGNIQQGGLNAVRSLQVPSLLTGEFPTLSLPVVGGLFRSLAPALVGLLVIASALATGWKYSLVVIPGALIALLGPFLGVPGLGFPQGAHWLSAAIGSAVIVGGGLAIRTQDRSRKGGN